jgi:isochorismate pyruvate lyase
MSNQLSALRSQIDALDVELINLLAKREKLVGEVLVYKKAQMLPARIQSRIDEVINNAGLRAKVIGMNPDLARTVWAAMVEWFVQHEEGELNATTQSSLTHTPSSNPEIADLS